jgi:hypothetical protein
MTKSITKIGNYLSATERSAFTNYKLVYILLYGWLRNRARSKVSTFSAKKQSNLLNLILGYFESIFICYFISNLAVKEKNIIE